MEPSKTPTTVISVALEYYKSGRAELIERVRLRDQVLLVYLAFVGAISGASFSVGQFRDVVVVLPFVGLGCAILVSQHNSVIGALIRYINEDLRPFIDKIVRIQEFDRIQEFVSSDSFKNHSRFSNDLRSVGHGTIILFPEIGGLIINFQHAGNLSLPMGLAWWFGVACVTISFSIIGYSHYLRNKVYFDTYWKKEP